MPYSKRYYRKKRYGYSAKRGYRKASRYRRRYAGYRRRSYRRYGVARRVSSINRRLYALLKKMDVRFKFTKPYYSVVDRKKKKGSRRKSYKSTKAQLAAMEAIKAKAAERMAARALSLPVSTDVSMTDAQFAAALRSPDRYEGEDLSSFTLGAEFYPQTQLIAQEDI